jgi:hypothetical protein
MKRVGLGSSSTVVLIAFDVSLPSDTFRAPGRQPDGRQHKAVREGDAETERPDALSRRDWRDRCDDEREERENDGSDQRQ